MNASDEIIKNTASWHTFIAKITQQVLAEAGIVWIPDTVTQHTLSLNFITVDLLPQSIPRRILANRKIRKLLGSRKLSQQSCGSCCFRKVYGTHPCHNQTNRALLHTGPELLTPSQFDILNNYWICHQTKLSDTKSCVNLWLLPLNYEWLHELFIKRKRKRKETMANKKKKKMKSWK